MELQETTQKFVSKIMEAEKVLEIAKKAISEYPVIKNPKEDKKVREILNFVHVKHKEYEAERTAFTRILDAEKAKLIAPAKLLKSFIEEGKKLLDEFANAQRVLSEIEAYKIQFADTLSLSCREQAIADKTKGIKKVPDILKLMPKPYESYLYDAYKELCTEYAGEKLTHLYLHHYEKVEVDKPETIIETAELKEQVAEQFAELKQEIARIKPQNSVEVWVAEVTHPQAYFDLFNAYIGEPNHFKQKEDKNLSFLLKFAEKNAESLKGISGLVLKKRVKSRL